MSKISQYPEATTLTDVKFLGNQAGVTKQIPATLLGPLVYKALTSQIEDGEPTVNELVNTIGEIVVARISAGSFSLISDGLFTINKTFINCASYYNIDELVNIVIYINNVNQLTILTYSDGIATDGILSNYPIKIEVYP